MYTGILWNEYELKTLSKTETGRFVLCESKEPESTRLFIHQFNRWSSAFTKDGWWDTFTLSDKPCKKGFYLCEIKKFKFDRNGYINMIVYPNKYLGETVDEDSIGWDYLASSAGRLAYHYKSRHYRSRYNVTHLNRVFVERFEESGYDYMEHYIFAEFMADRVSLEEIASALEEKLDIEKLADDINRNIENYREKYPLLVKKLPKEYNYGYGDCYTTDCTVEFLQRKSIEYRSLKLGSEEIILDRVEAVLKYWVDFHKAKKAAKKASKNK